MLRFLNFIISTVALYDYLPTCWIKWIGSARHSSIRGDAKIHTIATK